jgi:hypothetical protein
MLSPDDPRLGPLREQAEITAVAGMCPCGCATIDFAVDSIPAIFAITQIDFIVFTSNIFAILGLRSMYFALDRKSVV